MTDPTDLQPDDEARLQRILDACLELDPSEWHSAVARACADHPDLADRLKEHFPLLDDSISGSTLDMTAPVVPPKQEHPEAIGPYQIERVIARGGMGVVFLATQVVPVQRRVAVKLIRLGMDTQQILLRFDKERQALAMMEHDNIAKIYDAGATEDGRPYFVMEYVPSAPITDYCDAKRLRVAARLELFRAICDGVQHAHAKGVLHRDLKPSNVLVAEQGTRAIPKIIDFGLARALDEQADPEAMMTVHGQVLGTPEYMSPEQAGAGMAVVDTRTDVYALGVILYELLTGTLPFAPSELRGVAPAEMLRRIREADPPRPSTRVSNDDESREELARTRGMDSRSLVRRLRGDLDWIVMKALEKVPGDRYLTPEAFADDVARFLSHAPIKARPHNARYRLGKLLRRHAGFVAATLLVFATLAAGAIVSWTLYRDAERERRVARAAERRATGARLAAEARAIAASDPTLAMLLALEAADFEPDHNVRSATWDALLHHRELATLDVHGSAVHTVRFSRDGKLLVTASLESVVCVWDVKSRTLLHRLVGHAGIVRALDIRGDGRVLATASDDGTARVWDVIEGRTIRVLTGHGGALTDVQFSPHGRRILTASRDRTARLWNAETGAEIRSFEGHRRPVFSARFDPAGTHAVTLSFDHRVRLFRLADGATLRVFDMRRKLPRLSHALPWIRENALKTGFDPTGEFVWAASRDTVVLRMWNRQTGELVGEFTNATLAGFHDGIAHVVQRRPLPARWLFFDPKARKVVRDWPLDDRYFENAVLSEDGRIGAKGAATEVDLWDLATGERLERFTGHVYDAHSVAISPDGRTLASGGLDKTVRIWDAASPLRSQRRGKGALSRLCPHSSATDSAIGIFVRKPDPVRWEWTVWNTDTNERLFALGEVESAVRDATVSPDGAHVFSVHEDGRVRIWDIARRSVQRSFAASLHSGIVWSPDGRRAAFHENDPKHKGILIRQLPSGRLERVLQPEAAALTVAWSPDGELLAAVPRGNESQVRIYRVADGELVRQFPRRHQAWAMAIAFSPDGRRLAILGNGTRAAVWDVRTGEKLATCSGLPTMLHGGIGWTKDARLVWVRTDPQIVLFEADTGRRHGRCVTPEARFHCASLSRDERWIVAGVESGIVLKWPLDPVRFARDRVPRPIFEHELDRFDLSRHRPTQDRLLSWYREIPTLGRLRRGGSFLVRLGETDRAIAFYEDGARERDGLWQPWYWAAQLRAQRSGGNRSELERGVTAFLAALRAGMDVRQLARNDRATQLLLEHPRVRAALAEER